MKPIRGDRNPTVVSPPVPRSPPKKVASPPKPQRVEIVFPPKKNTIETASPPVSTFKVARADSKVDEPKPAPKVDDPKPILKVDDPKPTLKVDDSKPAPKADDPKPTLTIAKQPSVEKETPKIESPPVTSIQTDKPSRENSVDSNKNETEQKFDDKVENKVSGNEESNGVGDKIKKFEKAAEDASASAGRMSRPGSVRGRSRTERLGSDSKEDLPPPATPFKDNVHFDLPNSVEKTPTVVERQQSLKNSNANLVAKWSRSDSSSFEGEKVKPEPQKIIKPEFKPIASPVDVTIRSPSLGAKIPDQFPSHGTAFRNVASPDPARPKPTDNDVKPCKFKNKEKYSVSKGSSYFTRGSEEIWLVKKKDIEEIEERVLDSFRRAGGNVCMRSESMRPASDSGQGAAFTHATMGRNKRQMYARSESLDPQWAGARAQTLKRQSSVACTCGHDKKTRPKPPTDQQRPRSRSHGDDNASAHVLDKYETLV